VGGDHHKRKTRVEKGQAVDVDLPKITENRNCKGGGDDQMEIKKTIIAGIAYDRSEG